MQIQSRVESLGFLSALHTDFKQTFYEYLTYSVTSLTLSPSQKPRRHVSVKGGCSDLCDDDHYPGFSFVCGTGV
jgi:hypothetical protein